MANRPRTWSCTFFVLLGVPASSPAQEETPPLPTGQEKPTERKKTGKPRRQLVWIELRTYDEKTSRLAFSACDNDGDDRLDIREARQALPNMGTADDPAGFRALDANRNGFVHWDEFDGRFRRLVKLGDFLFRPTRPFLPPRRPKPRTAADETKDAVNVIMTMVADDEDPDISKREFTKLLAKLKQPASLAASFATLDTDQSGRLSATELMPVVEKVPYLLELAKIDPKAVVKPTVSPTALHRRLDRLHPTLARWSKQIFRTADRDGNGKLSGQEIDPPAK